MKSVRVDIPNVVVRREAPPIHCFNLLFIRSNQSEETWCKGGGVSTEEQFQDPVEVKSRLFCTVHYVKLLYCTARMKQMGLEISLMGSL